MEKNKINIRSFIFLPILMLAIPAACSLEASGSFNQEWLLCKDAIESAKKAVVRNHVNSIIRSLQVKAGRIRTLDYFGKTTMREGALAMESGGLGVEFLSVHFNRPELDWKVKYWIADILGYIKTAESERTLQRIINSPNTLAEIKKKAADSLNEIRKTE